MATALVGLPSQVPRLRQGAQAQPLWLQCQVVHLLQLVPRGERGCTPVRGVELVYHIDKVIVGKCLVYLRKWKGLSYE